MAGFTRTDNILMEVARIEGFRCCKAAGHHAYFRGLGTLFPTSPNQEPGVRIEPRTTYDQVEIFGVHVLEIGIFLVFGIWVLEFFKV